MNPSNPYLTSDLDFVQCSERHEHVPAAMPGMVLHVRADCWRRESGGCNGYMYRLKHSLVGQRQNLIRCLVMISAGMQKVFSLQHGLVRTHS